MVPLIGFEPTAPSLRMRCSTPELKRHGKILCNFIEFGPKYQSVLVKIMLLQWFNFRHLYQVIYSFSRVLMKKKWFATGMIVLALSSGVYLASETPGKAAAQKSPAQGAGQAVAVEAAKVQTGRIDRIAEAVGNLTSNESVMLRPEIAGRVTGILFEEGQAAKKGAPLIQLDDVILKAELQQMETSLHLSKTNYDRAERLFTQDAESGSSRDEALAKRNTDQAGVDLAKARLERMTISAPFDGVVGLRNVSIGDYVDIGQDLVNIESIDPLKVDFKLPEMYLSSLKPGQPIEVMVDAFPRKSFKGEVYAINPLVEANGRTIVLRAKLPNPDVVLRPGLFARVHLTLGATENALLVPEEAIVPEGTKQYVYKVEGDTPVMTEVQTGLRRKGQVEIVKGLSIDDTVITAGQMKLRPNSKIKVVSAEEDKAK